MADKSFVLMSLQEDKIKKMTQVLSNNTCRKILEYLSNHDKATATDISKELKLAMSTVHYNLKQLVDNGLVTSNEYHYSEKGKEVIHYGLANKYIIIAPKEDKTVLDKLRKFLPITAITAATGALFYFIESQWDKINFAPWIQTAMTKSSEDFSAMMDAEVAMAPAMRSLETAATAEPTTTMLIAPWFIAGAAFAIIIMVVYDLSKKNK